MGWEQFGRVDLEALVSPAIMERGQAYYQEGHLQTACRIGPVRAGILTGTSGNYQAKLWFDPPAQLQWACTCPYPEFCKHLVALALSWLERPQRFEDLQPRLEGVLADPGRTADLLERLVVYHPFSFWELTTAAPGPAQFISNRGLLNLVRNVFSPPQLNLRAAEAIWEEVERLERLLVTRLRQGDSEALPALAELLQGLLAELAQERNQLLQERLEDLLKLAKELPRLFSGPALQPLSQALLNHYFQPNFWEYSGVLREALQALALQEPEPLLAQVEARIGPGASQLQLIAAYELLQGLAAASPTARAGQDRVSQLLKVEPAGRLWMIDRYWENQPELAYQLAQQGLHSTDSQLKLACRERLIRWHQEQNESKQAAALSFIQFQAQPNFEEYLRLKGILQRHPALWDEYRQRIKQQLRQEQDLGFLVRLALDQGEYSEVAEYLELIGANPELCLAVADCFNQTELPVELAPAYQQLIQNLLAAPLPRCGKAALQTLAVYKKRCQQWHRLQEWQRFRERLIQQHQDDHYFTKKFGAVLEIKRGESAAESVQKD